MGWLEQRRFAIGRSGHKKAPAELGRLRTVFELAATRHPRQNGDHPE
jgi:hypothetical protein